MIKRLVLLALILFPAVVLTAGVAPDRDALVTTDGTMYAVGSVSPGETLADSGSSRVLRLDVRRDGTETSIYVPGSLTGGSHTSPSLAYDTEGRTLYIFWQKMPNMMSSELLFCSYHDGEFSEPTSIDNATFSFRFNLQIGVTRVVEDHLADGTVAKSPMLLVHATWWDQTGYGEVARYGQLAIRDRQVVSIDLHDLTEFVGDRGLERPGELPADFDRDIFRHPAVFEVPGRDAVQLVFGDWDVNRFYRVTLKPIAENGVLRVPIPVQRGELPPPSGFNREISSTMSVLTSTASDKVIFYSRSESFIRYAIFSDGAWSNMTTIPVGESFSAEAGVDALRRLAGE